MALERFLDSQPVRTMRTAAATVKAVGLFVGVLIAGGAVLISTFKPHIKSDKALIAPSAIFLGLIVVSGVCLWYYIEHVCDPEPYEVTSISGMLTIEAVGDHHQYKNTRHQTIKALRNGVRLVEVRTRWTGDSSKDKLRTESTEKDHKLFDGRDREEDWRVHRWIYLGRALKKGQRASVGVYQEWEDDLGPMHPYYREGGSRYKTRNMIVTVRFPRKRAPDRSDVEGLVWGTERYGQRSEVGNLNVLRELDQIPGYIDYSVIVRRPRRGQSYGLRWKWPDV
jgi:hypothetical protein